MYITQRKVKVFLPEEMWVILTLFHHANVHTAFEPACLAVAPVVLGDGATAIKGTGEAGLTLHTAPE